MDDKKNIDELIDKLLKDDELNTTSMHFTNAVMTQVKQLNEQKVFEYKPLIAKRTWFLIGTTILGLLIYIGVNVNFTETKWMKYFQFNLNLNFLPEFGFSSTTLYATITISLLFLIQIILLKNYFNKRLSV